MENLWNTQRPAVVGGAAAVALLVVGGAVLLSSGGGGSQLTAAPATSSVAPTSAAPATSAAPVVTTTSATAPAAAPTSSLSPPAFVTITPVATTSRAPATTSAATGTSGPTGTCDAGSFAQNLTSDADTYPRGTTVQMTLTVTWNGSAPCSTSTGADPGHFTVANEQGTVVWTAGCSSSPAGHSGAQACPAIAQLVTFQPGESRSYSQGWAQQEDATSTSPVMDAPAGGYTLMARFVDPGAWHAVTLTG